MSNQTRPPDTHQVMPDIIGLRTLISNVFFVGAPGPGNEWFLIDTGMPYFADTIRKVAEERYGPGTRPKAIILTHGHFDHVGSVKQLAEQWGVPVYAHELELPYLEGQSNYPKPDPTAGGGLLSTLSAFYPNQGINLGNFLYSLPTNGGILGMPDWRWIHTPGHTEGHISLFRESDGVLIAGDAFTTVKQESAVAVLIQYKKVHGPPAYFTPDWTTAWKSVKALENLKPLVAATGHGLPMRGEQLSQQLTSLSQHFDRDAIPEEAKYVF